MKKTIRIEGRICGLCGGFYEDAPATISFSKMKILDKSKASIVIGGRYRVCPACWVAFRKTMG